MKMKTVIKLMVILTAGIFFQDVVLAATPFDKADSKGNEILEFLRGGFARTVLAIVVTFAGYKIMAGSEYKKTLLAIAGGAILIALAPEIADWLPN